MYFSHLISYIFLNFSFGEFLSWHLAHLLLREVNSTQAYTFLSVFKCNSFNISLILSNVFLSVYDLGNLCCAACLLRKEGLSPGAYKIHGHAAGPVAKPSTNACPHYYAPILILILSHKLSQSRCSRYILRPSTIYISPPILISPV